jgi:branched-chain amino acid transport system ATP-binding protein
VVMSSGAKIAEGSPDRVLSDAGVIGAYLGVDDDA